MNPSEAAQRFALALPGVWLTVNQRSFQHLGGRPAGPAARKWAKGLLGDSWGVRSAESLREKLTWLSAEGHSAEYFTWRERYAETPESERESHLRLIFMKIYGQEVGDTGLVAWDQCRLINVAGWGFLAGYLTEEEAWEVILPAARACQEAYPSWDALGRAYLVGVAFWGPAHIERNQPGCDALLGDPNSPWRTTPWDTPLGAAASGAAESGGGFGGGMMLVAGLGVVAVLALLCLGGVAVTLGGMAVVGTSVSSAPTVSGGGAAPGPSPGSAGSGWDGQAPLVCEGSKTMTVSGVTARLPGAVAITAKGSCKLTLERCDVEAGTALRVEGAAQVTVTGGRLAGSDHAVEALNASKVTLSGTTIEGKTTKKNAAKITGP